jgi:hypothetical protein
MRGREGRCSAHCQGQGRQEEAATDRAEEAADIDCDGDDSREFFRARSRVIFRGFRGGTVWNARSGTHSLHATKRGLGDVIGGVCFVE